MPCPPVLCLGSALWDILAHAARPLHPGADLAGRIVRRPGGVALNIASALAAQDCAVALLSVVGDDPDGAALIAEAGARGVDCRWIARTALPTDTYLAIEAPDGELFAAVADCAALEASAGALLAPLCDGRLGSAARPYSGTLVIDSNLPDAALDAVVRGAEFAAARRVFVPASPGKAERLRRALRAGGATIYLNRMEAEILALTPFGGAAAAAAGLCDLGAAQAVVTDGRRAVACATAAGVVSVEPPAAVAGSKTGAGDVFLAAHLRAEARGLGAADALHDAIAASARHITGA